MPERITHLSEVKVRTANPQKKDYKIFNGGRLFPQVTPSDGKLWYLNYHYANKERKRVFHDRPWISGYGKNHPG